MKTSIGLFALFALLTTVVPSEASVSNYATRPGTSSSADNGGDLGLGIMLGEPTGLTGKYWLSNVNALDFGFTYSFSSYYAFLCDYLWHFSGAFNSVGVRSSTVEVVPYLGIGGILFVDNGSSATNHHFFTGDGGNSAALGARIPIGLEFLPKTVPVGIFAEIDPGIGLVPGIFGFVEGELGGRFYF